MTEYENIQLLDILGFPKYQNEFLFSSSDNILIYPFGSNIIYYNLNTNTKTFINLSSLDEIIVLKFIDNENKSLLTINNNQTPLINVWDLNIFENIFSQEISIKNNYNIDFKIAKIFIEKIKNNFFLILISSQNSDDYILYKFYLLNDKYYLEPFFSQINQITNEKINKSQIIGFKFFLNSSIGVLIYNSSISFFEIDIDGEIKFNLKKNITFNYTILPNSFSISYDYNLLSLITSKGNCLLYDINYNNKTSINPYNQDDFNISFFSKDSIYLGTNNGRIFVYQLSDYKLKYYINYNKIHLFKKEFQLNYKKLENQNDDYYENDFDGPSIDYIDCDEQNDKIFIKMGDNSILLSPIRFIIDNQNGYINDKLKTSSSLLYAYNHSRAINDIEFFPLSNNEIIDYPIINDKMKTIFYSCSKEQIIIKYYINHEDNKIYNQYFDFSDNFNSQRFREKYMNCFSVLKFHPIQKNYLFIGDQKGCLYILDTNKNNIIYKQYMGETYSVASLSFNQKGDLLCLGLETGMQLIYYINNLYNTNEKFEKYFLLTNHYFSPEEIEMRQNNNHILSYNYFFNQNKLNENKIIYMKNKNSIECSLIIERSNNYRKILFHINLEHKILDMKIHKGEKYIIILDDDLKINIYDLISKNNIGIIDLNGQVKYANNIDIDISGLYLSLLCQLKNSNNEKGDIILFETGTGNVHSFISGMSPLIKIKFDFSGNYLLVAGIKGEIYLLGLDEAAIYSIKNVIEQMNKNPKFLEEYEILFNNENEKYNSNNYDKNLNNNLLSRPENNFKNEISGNTFKNINKKASENIKYKYKNNFDDSNKTKNINYSFRLNHNGNNNVSNNKNKYFTENNTFKSLSNRNYNSENLKNKIVPEKLFPISLPNKYKNKNLYTNSTNNFNTSYSNKTTNKFNYSLNKFNNAPRLSYINIVNNKFNNFKSKNRLYFKDKINLNSYLKKKKEIEIKNINNAINELMSDESKEKENISNSRNIFSFSNKVINNNFSSFYSYDTNFKNKPNSTNNLHDIFNISKDFMIINNKKINKSILSDKITNNNSINTTLLIYHKDKHKKYPEPKDIDEVENYYYINNNISNLKK